MESARKLLGVLSQIKILPAEGIVDRLQKRVLILQYGAQEITRNLKQNAAALRADSLPRPKPQSAETLVSGDASGTRYRPPMATVR